MSLGDAYTLGVRVTGDIQALRQELAAGNQVIAQFANTSVAAMNRAAAAMEQSAATMQASAKRTAHHHGVTGAAATRYSVEEMRAASVTVRALRNVEDQTKRTAETTVRSTGSMMGALGRLTGYAGLALVAKQVWDIGLGFNEFTQNTQIALTSLMGSSGKAREFLADILAFAKQTPYAFPDLTAQAQQLLTWGFAAKDVIPILRAAGDAATTMGKGKEGVDRLVLALGQINTKGRLQSQELLQLSEVGVNGLKILANQAGMTTVDYQKLVSDGLVPAKTAIEGIVNGLNEGTRGINGQTAAFGGMMEKIKGSGGITATLDSTRTSIRNTSGAITDVLVPSFLSMLRGLQDVLGAVKRGSQAFGDLPVPVQNAALAMVAASTAAHFLGPRLQSSATGFGAAAREAYRYQTALATANGVTNRASILLATAGMTAKSALRGVGAAVMGAFGGPVGLAITAAATAVAAFAGANAAAKARTAELADTLDQVTGALTEQSTAWIQNALTAEQNFGVFNSKSLVDAAQEMGISVDLLTRAYMGQADAIDEAKAKAKAWADEDRLNNDLFLQRSGQVTVFNGYLDDQVDRLKTASEIAQAKGRIDQKSTDILKLQNTAVKENAAAWKDWSEEEFDAIQKSAQAARDLANLRTGNLDLNLATEDDLASAREKVAEATRRVRDAEVDREETFDRKGVTRNDKVKAEEAVADARKALEDATKSLGETEARTDPVAQYRKQVEQIKTDMTQFVQDIQTLADRGLNAFDLSQLIQAGPEGSADVRKALLGDPGAIDFTNEARQTLDSLGETLAQQATVAQSAITAGQAYYDQIGLGMRIAAQNGASSTVQDIADALASNPFKIYNVGKTLGLAFLRGMSDANTFQNNERTATGAGGGGGTTAFAGGGVLPGYTPGRDIYRFMTRMGAIDLSGGEAIMRPEFTRAVSPRWVHHMNAVARTLGAAGVRREMARFLGGFAGGGVVSPQVVTVPVQVTNERNTPWTIQNAWFTDPKAAQGWGDRQRAMDAWGGA